MKAILFSLILALGALSGCKSDGGDPTPTPNYIGYWKFESAVIVPKSGSNDVVSHLSCTEKHHDLIFQVEYNLTSTSEITQVSTCIPNAQLYYVPVVTGNVLTEIDLYADKDHGSPAGVFNNITINTTTKEITANMVLTPGDASTLKSITYTFQLQ